MKMMGDAGYRGKVGARKMREDFDDSLVREAGEDGHDERWMMMSERWKSGWESAECGHLYRLADPPFT